MPPSLHFFPQSNWNVCATTEGCLWKTFGLLSLHTLLRLVCDTVALGLLESRGVLVKTGIREIDEFVGLLPPLERHFATLMERRGGGDAPELRLAAGLASYFTTQQGHVCIDLKMLSESTTPLPDVPDRRIPCPKFSTWISKLRASNVVGEPGEFRPLILDNEGRLYLQRYWKYEVDLAQQIKSRVGQARFNAKELGEGLRRLFPKAAGESTNWQQVAAFMAVTRKFCVISGGPGTGKTTTVIKILALLLEQARPNKLRIALAAPTGKAAARLQESVALGKEKLNCAAALKEQLPEHAFTLHRLLGRKIDSPHFRYDAQNHLPFDVIVVDEASMVDLALMSKFFQAVPAQARIILLGDKDQLSSVEAGAVLGDICGDAENQFSKAFIEEYQAATGEKISIARGENGSVLRDNIVQLQRNFRFSVESALGSLSQAVKARDTARVNAVLEGGQLEFGLSANDAGTHLSKGDPAGGDGISWQELPKPARFAAELKTLILGQWRRCFAAATAEEALRAFNLFRILCAVRNGREGVTEVNALVENLLASERLIDPRGKWYRGRPVMVTTNDYHLQLFNGDIGIVWPDEKTGEPVVCFPGEDGSVRQFLPLRLPEHETVYAMTVHKSQGTEFENVLFLLPERDHAIITRELIYTGLTRARKQVYFWCGTKAVAAALARDRKRSSGMRNAFLPTPSR